MALACSLPQHCIGIIFQSTSSKKKSAHRIFESFLEENRACFWNLELVDAVNNLDYVGFMRPGTLFVSSAHERHLNSLRAAWSRRTLKPAKGFTIVSFGDIGGIQLQEIEQMHFVPLGDMLCNAVARLNKLGCPATPESLRVEIAEQCPSIQAPSLEMLRRTIENLLATGLVYRMGEHLFVSIPASAPYHTRQAPLKCTVECQTGKSIVGVIDSANKHECASKHKKGFFARLFSKKDSPAKVAPKRKEPVAFSAQFPPPEWMCNPTLAAADVKCIKEKDLPKERFCTFAGHLCDEVERKRYRVKHRRGERHLSSSSECLNYGPVDPPEYLPRFADAELVQDLKDRRKRRARRRGDGWLDAARTSTPVSSGSDSAYSVSPVVTEMSLETREHCQACSTGDATGLESARSGDHTYVNIRTHESTQFEEITQVERLLPSSLHISNV